MAQFRIVRIVEDHATKVRAETEISVIKADSATLAMKQVAEAQNITDINLRCQPDNMFFTRRWDTAYRVELISSPG